MSFKQFREELGEDATFVKFRSVYRTCQSALNIERTENEIRSTHAGRSSRSLTSAKISITALMKATSEDLSARSRLVEINLLVHRTEELLSTAIKNIRKYLISEYRDDLTDLSGPTKADRDGAVDRILSTPLAYLSSLSSLSKQIEMLVKDLDQASYGLNRLESLLKQQLDRKEAHL